MFFLFFCEKGKGGGGVARRFDMQPMIVKSWILLSIVEKAERRRMTR